jgi:G3E family GTPase
MKLRNKTSSSRAAHSGANFDKKTSAFILLGGFLGAGKTTCLMRLAAWLQAQGLRPGIITNDQGDGLVDTASAMMETKEAVRQPERSGDRRTSRPSDNVRQITGGCFCCRSGELMAALAELEKSAQPDVYIAEPVGSCTDLVATVLLPLEQVYQAGLRRAPMSVVLDAKRVWQNYFGKAKTGSGAGGGFSKDVRYIYLKQMEEAEILVLNKVDLLTAAQLKKVEARLQADFPRKAVRKVSGRSGSGLDEWFAALMATDSSPEAVIEIDYVRYGVGEALMGWYNAKVEVGTKNEAAVDGNTLLLTLAVGIQKALEKVGAEIGHFKMSLSDSHGALGVVNVVRNGDAAELSRRLPERVIGGELLINLRAEAAPDVLEKIVAAQVANLGKKIPLRWVEQAAFRPGQPKPTHRVTKLESAHPGK